MPKTKAPLIILFIVAILGLGYILLQETPTTKAPVEALKGDPNVPIGGEFSLRNGAGEAVKESSFRGKFMLIYFGYTSCPDVCPFDMQKMAIALEQVEESGQSLSSLQPIFISIDPHRDSPDISQEFANAYHDSIIGLSGTDAETKMAKDAYRVYAQVAPEDEEAKTKGEFYKVNHSNLIFLMDKNGHYMKHFTTENTPEDIAKALKSILD